MNNRKLIKNMFHKRSAIPGQKAVIPKSQIFLSSRGGGSVHGSVHSFSTVGSQQYNRVSQENLTMKAQLIESKAANAILQRDKNNLMIQLETAVQNEEVITSLRKEISDLKGRLMTQTIGASNSGRDEDFSRIQKENSRLKIELEAAAEEKADFEKKAARKEKHLRSEISRMESGFAEQLDVLREKNNELADDVEYEEKRALACFHMADTSAGALGGFVAYLKRFQLISVGKVADYTEWEDKFFKSVKDKLSESANLSNIYVLQTAIELVSEQPGKDTLLPKLNSLLHVYHLARAWEQSGSPESLLAHRHELELAGKPCDKASSTGRDNPSVADTPKSPNSRQSILEGSQATPVKFFSPSNHGQSKMSEREYQKQTLYALTDLFSKMGNEVDLSRYEVVWPTSNELITARAAAVQLNYIAGSVLSDTDFDLMLRAAGMSDSQVAVAADVLAQLLVIWDGPSSVDPIRPISADLLSTPKNVSENLNRLVKNFNQLKEIVVKTLEKYDMIATDTDGKQSIEGSVVELFAQISRMDTLNEENQNLKADNRAKDDQKKLADAATASAKKLYEELLTKYIIGVGTMARSVRERFFEAIGATYAKAAIGMLSDTTEDDRPNIYESYLMPFAGEHVHRAHLQVLVNCLAAEPQFNEGHPLAVTPTELVRTMIYGEPFPSESPGSISREFIFSTLTRLVGERQERFSFAELEREFTPLISAAASNDRSSSGSVDSFSSDNVVIRQRPCAPNIGRLPHQGQFVFSPARGVCSADNTDRTPKKTKPTKPFVVSTPKKS